MLKPSALLFGTPGIPISTQHPTTTGGIARVHELGLDAMELEFVRSINISSEMSPIVKKAADENNVVLTCHAPYFINLNSLEKPKLYASIQRIVKSAEILNMCNGWSLCFHPGFYLKMEKEKVYNNIKQRIKEIAATLKKKGIDIWLRPETTGKESQFGSFDELLNISAELEGVMPCVDFSHLHARSSGKFNTEPEFKDILTKIEKILGRHGLDNMHIHLSGINYTEKGERNHLDLEESDMNWKGLLKVWKEFRIKGVVISESPNIEGDALLLKKNY